MLHRSLFDSLALMLNSKVTVSLLSLQAQAHRDLLWVCRQLLRMCHLGLDCLTYTHSLTIVLASEVAPLLALQNGLARMSCSSLFLLCHPK